MDLLMQLFYGFLGGFGYPFFKRFIIKFINNRYLISALSLLICIGIGVAINCLIRYISHENC